MGVHPIRRDPVGPVPRSNKANEVSQQRTTAVKVVQIAQLPSVKQKGWRGREIALMKDATGLAKYIRTNWDLLAPEELAEKIVDLEDRVSCLKGTSPAIAKIAKEARSLHFRFVFPVALELEMSGKSMPPSFARTIYQTAKQVFEMNSLHPFHRLSPVQQQEVVQIATGGVEV